MIMLWIGLALFAVLQLLTLFAFRGLDPNGYKLLYAIAYFAILLGALFIISGNNAL